ncbi:unnamed protein product [Closterium sp. NIES-54]
MHSRLLVFGLPKSVPSLPPSPAPPCLPCVEGQQRAAPHSSSFPLTSAPLQTLHMDVWGPARVNGQSRERYFLLVVDDYTRPSPAPRLVRRLHSDRGGEFSSNLLRYFCRGEGILLLFTLPDSPQQNGIAERRIGLVMELNLWPRVSLPETSPTLRWTGEVGDASVFRVWGSRAFVRDMSADKLSPRAIPCVFLGFVPDAPGWQFYHPTSRRVFPSQNVTFDESVPGLAPSSVSQVDPLPGPAPLQVALDSVAARGAASGGAKPGGAVSEGAETGGAEPEGVETRGAEPGGVAAGGAELEGVEPGGAELGGAASEGAESGGAEPQGAALFGGSAGASPELSLQQLRVWFVWRACLRSGDTGAGGARDGGARVADGAGVTGGTAATSRGGARTRGTGAAGTGGVGGAGAGFLPKSGTGAGGAGAVDPGGTVRPRPYFVPLLQQVLGTPPSAALTPPLLCPPPDQSQPSLQPASPLRAPSPYTEQSGGLTERREPTSRPVSPVCTARRVPRSRPPPLPCTHAMTLRPSSVPLLVPLPAPLESSLPEVPDPESYRTRTASPTVSRLLATADTDPSFGSAAASALVAELLDFAAACRPDYAIALIAESASASPLSVKGECALGMDVLEERQEDFECLAAAVPGFASMLLAPEGDPDAPDIPTPRSYAEAITGPYSSQWQAAMDAKMASWKSTGTYVDEVPPPGANVVDGMWIFRVKRPPSSPRAFKARYVARGFSQRQGVEYFRTLPPTPKMTTLWVLLHVAAQRDYELHSLDFSTAFLQGSLHEEIWTTLAALGLAPATADPSLFLRTDTWLPLFYILVYVNDLIFATAHTEALTLVKSELQKRHTCTDVGVLCSYLGLQITRERARCTITLTQSHMAHHHSALRLPVLLATAHSSVYQPLALSSTFGRVRRAEWSVPKACGFPHVPDDVHSTRPRVPSQPPGSLRGSRQAPKVHSLSFVIFTATADAVARLAVRNYLPLAERAHFKQHKNAKALYDAVVARYSSLSSAALGRLILPYMFPELSVFATVEDLITHLCTSDTRYCTTLPSEFLDKNPPPMYINLFFIVTRLPDSLRAVTDHFLMLDPTDLTVDLLEKHLLAAETSVVAVGAARGTPRTPFFEGCSPSPLDPSYASAAAVDILGTEDVGAAYAFCLKRCSGKGKGGKSGGGGSGGGGGGGGGGGRGGGSGGSGGGSGDFGSGGSGSGGSGSGGSGSGGGGSGGRRGGAVQRGGSGGGQRQQQQRRSETPTPKQLCEWFSQRGAFGGSIRCLYVIHTGDRVGHPCGKFHTQHRCFSRLDDAWRAEFDDEGERPCLVELLRSGVDIFALDYNAILAAMYALSVSAVGYCYLCVPPDPGIEAAGLGASESALLGTAPVEALHTFTLDLGASRCFFCDSTTLTPLPAPIPVRLADPSRGPVLAHSSTVLPCPAVAASAEVSASGPVATPCSCRLLSHQTLLWHHCLGHPSLPRLCSMHFCLLVSGLPRSLPSLPLSPAPLCLPCVEGRQRAAPHFSSFPPTTAPLQTLHMDVWGPARVSGQDRERYFLLVVDDYTRYTTVFHLRSKGEVPDVLIP